MSDYVLIPISDTDAARVQMPLAFSRDERLAYLAALPDDVLASAERVPLPGATAPAPDPAPTEDGR